MEPLLKFALPCIALLETPVLRFGVKIGEENL